MDFGIAVECGNVKRVKELLENATANANQNVSGGDRYKNVKPLLLASAKGHVLAAALLLDHGADVDALSPGYDGYLKTYTPLFAAVHRNHISMVSFLLSKNADPNKYDKESPYCTPLFVAADENSNLEAVELLLSSPNIDTTIVDGYNKTAADVAKDDLIKKLIQIKFYEQQRDRLCKEVPKIKAEALKLKISEKREQISEMSLKAGNLLDEISVKKSELEILQMEIMQMECDVIELNEKLTMLDKHSKTQDLQVGESLVECLCCLEIRPSSDTAMYECTSGHVFCVECADNLNN